MGNEEARRLAVGGTERKYQQARDIAGKAADIARKTYAAAKRANTPKNRAVARKFIRKAGRGPSIGRTQAPAPFSRNRYPQAYAIRLRGPRMRK